MKNPNKGAVMKLWVKKWTQQFFFLDKLIQGITLDSVLILRLALLIISFTCSLKFSFVSTFNSK